MTVQGAAGTLTSSDLLVGEVWLASGQSNMEWPVARSENAAAVNAAADFPQVRAISAPHRRADLPLDKLDAVWEVAKPGAIGQWSAVAYFFALRLHEELGVPVGVLDASWGGTLIRPWIPESGFAQVEELSDVHEELLNRTPGTEENAALAGKHLAEVEAWLRSSKQAAARGGPVTAGPAFPAGLEPARDHQQSAQLWNGMTHPLVPFPLRGAIWYQGESNRQQDRYVERTRALLAVRRGAWSMPEMPYFYVQIAPYDYPNDSDAVTPEFWETQARIQEVIPHTGMVVTNDIGDDNDIHPANKRDVGRRLAGLALHDTYGRDDLLARGPQPVEMTVDGATATVRFDHAGDKLSTRDGKAPDSFELAGEGAGWTPATATITGVDTVAVTAAGVEKPAALRFAWTKLASPNLVNSAGLPTGTSASARRRRWTRSGSRCPRPPATRPSTSWTSQSSRRRSSTAPTAPRRSAPSTASPTSSRSASAARPGGCSSPWTLSPTTPASPACRPPRAAPSISVPCRT